MSAWEQYRIVRHPNRPAPRFYIERICEETFEIRGDRAGSEDPAVFCCLARLDGHPIVVAALDRGRPTGAGFRKAIRAIGLAGRLGLPLVTLVDTPGAEVAFDSEYGGLAAAIAATFEAILTAGVPVVSIVTGEGGSGGGLALACGDVIAIQEHAVFSVIAPEGAAEILYRDPSRAPEVAERLRPTAPDMIALGLADHLIPEPAGGAHLDPQAAAVELGRWLVTAIGDAKADPASRSLRFAQIKDLKTREK